MASNTVETGPEGERGYQDKQEGQEDAEKALDRAARHRLSLHTRII